MIPWLKALFKRTQSAQSTSDNATVECKSSQLESSGDDIDHRGLGNTFLNKGKLAEAEACYKLAIAGNPQDASVYINLGYVAIEQGRDSDAQAYLEQAVLIDSKLADGFYMLGTIFQRQGNLPGAIGNFEKVLALQPEFELVYRELCHVLFQAGEIPKAKEIILKGLAFNPEMADFHYYLGNLHAAEGASEAAIECFLKALALQPKYAEVHNNLGFSLQAQGKLSAAIESYKKALSLKPGFIDAYCNLGRALQAQGNLDNAVECYHKALQLNANAAEVYSNLGSVLRGQGKLEESIACCEKALLLKPGLAEAHLNLGLAQEARGELAAAVACYRQALSTRPDYAEAYNNLGNVLQMQGCLDEAINSYHAALALKPDYVEAYSNLGGALQFCGKQEQAISNYRHAVSLKPDFHVAHSNLLYALSFHEECLPQQYLDEAASYGAKVARTAKPYAAWSVAAVTDEKPLLRVGFMSGDLCTHPVGFFLESILTHLDFSRIQLVAYVTRLQEDALTARIKPHFAEWRLISGLSDQAAAQRIHEDGIHILVDLSGHTGHNRLPVFAWKPAPVQVSWLGYWASTGVPGMDYFLADPVSVPADHQKQFTEAIWYLPETRLCFTPPAGNPPLTVSELPALRKGHLTFGSFQTTAKIGDGVLALWGQVLQALPEATLRLQNKQLASQAAREEMLQRLAGFGIASHRISLQGGVPREEYLAAHAEVDIILDTFPFPGGTTTCEALWMGVPTVTLAGNTLLARQGASLLSCAGLQDWIAHDAQGYVACALTHAREIDQLARLRHDLRQQVQASPLFDARRFAQHFEQALHQMWVKCNYKKTDLL